MNKFKTVIAIITLILLALSGCSQSDNADSPTTLSPEETALVNYRKVIAQAGVSDTYTLTANLEMSTQVGSETLVETIVQTVSYQDLGKDTAAAELKQELILGDNTITTGQYYAGGNAYLSLDGSNFSTPSTIDDFKKDCIPAILINPELYTTIEVEESVKHTTLHFSQPRSGEIWILPKDSVLQDASGSVTLDKSNNLTQSTLSLSYIYGPASVSITVTSIPDFQSPVNIHLPDGIEVAQPVDSLRAAFLLEEACGYLLQGRDLSSQIDAQIKSDAFGLHRTQSSQICLSGYGVDQSALIDTHVTLTDFTRDNKVSELKQTESFKNGVYTVATDDNDPINDASVTADTIKKYCQDMLIGNILLPNYIQNAKMTTVNDEYRLEFSASEELACIVGENALHTLFSDPDILENITTQCVADTITWYLTINRYTGLPTSAGFHFSGQHIIEKTTYPLLYETNQTYTFDGFVSTPADHTQTQDATTPTE